MINIKSLKTSIGIKLEQYECEDCKKKSYANSEDKIDGISFCIFCEGKTKKVRIFDIEIKGIGDYTND